MDGALRLALTSGARFIAGSSLDLNFQRGKYLVDNQLKSSAEIDAYHTRSSAAYAELLDGDYAEYATNAARIISQSGYQHEAAGTNLATFNPQANSLSGGVAADEVTTGISDVFGGNDAIRLTMDAQPDTGENYLFRIFSTYTAEIVTGSFFAKLISNTGVTALTPDYGDGGSAGNILSQLVQNEWVRIACDAGTYSASNKQWFDLSASSGTGRLVVELCGFQVEEGLAITSPSDGARPADAMLIPAIANGLNFTEGALFWKGRMDEYADGRFPRAFSLGTGWDDVISAIRNNGADTKSLYTRAGGVTGFGKTVTNDDEFTVGITWRSDGSIAWALGDKSGTNPSAHVASATIPDLYIAYNGSSVAALNGKTERVVGFSKALSDDEFNQVFVEIAT